MAVSGAAIARAALKYQGTPYVWGGNSLTSGVDCSGLVQQVYALFGIRVPRVTYDQINVSKTLSADSLRAGDMVFFDTDRSTRGPDHVGIYLGGGKFIHAPRPGASVRVDNMTSSYYSSRFMGGVRAPGIQGASYDTSVLSNTGGGGGGGYMDAISDVDRTSRVYLSDEELAAQYGWSYAFLTSEPEIKDLFKQAVSETWEASKFKAKLQETNWWKNNSEARRQASVLKASDPASYSAAVEAMRTKLIMMANEMGAIIPEKTLADMAEDAYAGGLSDQQIQYSMAGYIDFTKEGTLGGMAGMAEVKMRQLARMNGVDLTPEAIKNFAQQIAMGVLTMEQVEQNIRNSAISLFPAYEEQITGGQSVQEIAAPYIMQMSKDLEITPAEAGLFNPMIKQALNQVDKDGNPVGMTVTDFQRAVRRDPRWTRTDNGRETLMTVANDVLKSLGLIS